MNPRSWWLVVLMLVGSPALANQQPMVVGLRLGLGGFLDGQIKTIFGEAFSYARRKTGLPLQVKLYADEKDLRMDAAKGLLAGAFVTSDERVKGFKPIAGVSLIGKSGYAHCFYVKQNSPIKTTAQMKGKRLSTQQFVPTYYELRRMLGKNPLEVFTKVAKSKPMAGFMALSLDQVDVAFEADVAYEFTKITNPGSIRKVKPLKCSHLAIAFPPIEARANLPPQVFQQLKNVFLTMHQAPPNEPYTRVVRSIRFQFVDPSKVNYKQGSQIYEIGKKSGWERDKDYWQSVLRNQQH